MTAYKIDTRKLRKVIDELVRVVDGLERQPNGGGHLRGMGAGIGKVGNYHISIDVDEFDSDDLGVHTEVIKGE